VARLYGLAEEACVEAEIARREEPPAARESATVDPTRAVPLAPGMPGGIVAMDWNALRETVRDCTACALCRQRKQAVFGVGDEAASWLFVGEGPGADEDEQGEPFVGQAGRLLDSMLGAMGLRRGADVYIANVVKCRPPGNRTPTPEESAACAPYLDRQIDLVAPRLIVALGKTAAVRLLNTEASLASLRGRVHRYRGIPVVVTYHPAYLLRSLPEKSKAWADLVFARRTLREAA
jgi:DNA polymerase